MKITATINNSDQKNEIAVETNGKRKEISIPAKTDGSGSSVNGGELLFLSLATCFCNDLYREAVRRNIEIQSVSVTVTGEFGNEGEPATGISYSAEIHSASPEHEIDALIRHVDQVAEIHNTLRKGVPVELHIH